MGSKSKLKGIMGRVLKAPFISIKRPYTSLSSKADMVSEIKCKVPVEDTEEVILDSRRIELDNPLPEETKILHVSFIDEAKPDNIRISCFVGDEEIVLADFSRPPNPAAFIEKGIPANEVIAQIREFSRSNLSKFNIWFRQQLKRYNDEFCIILYDKTDSNISWELMHVYIDDTSQMPDSFKETGEFPIGALATIVRWIPELEFYDRNIAFKVRRIDLSGKIVAYLDRNLKHLEKEEKALQRFKTIFCCNHNHFGDELKCNFREIALGYIVSHGIIVKDGLEKEKLVSSLDLKNAFSYRDWENLDFIPVEDARPFIFANACFSAWISRDKLHKPYKRYGLAITLLSRIAEGFIGTLGPVGNALDFAAPDIGKWILEELDNNGSEVSLSEIIRGLRQRAARNIKSNRKTEDWKLFLYMFEYIYYGNPFVFLKLQNADSDTGRGVS